MAAISRHWSSGLLLSLTLCLGACSGVPQGQTARNYSALPPDELLALYLETETPAEPMRFKFGAEVEAESGTRENLQGVCGYTTCGSLRMQLLGALGVTLLDYVNREGTARLVINKLTDEGDDAARDGLLQVLQILTLALVDRCHSSDEFALRQFDDARAEFSVSTSAGVELGITLDRRSGRLVRQTVTGAALSSASIGYSDYRLVDGRWLPGRLEIQPADQPTSISLVVERWSLGKPFPAGFFDDR